MKYRASIAAIAMTLSIVASAHADPEPLVPEPVPAPAEPARAEPVPMPAPPPPPKKLVWKDEWTPIQAADIVATGMMNGASIALALGGSPPEEPRWVGPILFDKPLRNALRVHGRDALQRARFIGDVAYISPIVYVFVDALVTPLVKGAPDVAWQLFMMNAEAYGVLGLVLFTSFETVGRARPAYRECQAGTTQDPLCDAAPTSSFPSGHTAGAFLAAGLTCVHHGHLPLYGGGAGDALACAGMLTLGTVTAASRLAGDRHYATDILVGGGVGFLVGYGVPWLLHYRTHARPLGELHNSATAKVGVTLGSGVTPAGASVYGIF